MKARIHPSKKYVKTGLTALSAAVFAVMLIFGFAPSSGSRAAGLTELEGSEGEPDAFGTSQDATAENVDADGNGTEPARTSDPGATVLPTTERGEHILFEGKEEGGSGGASAGSIIMIIIVVAALLSVVSGIVEKIVKYYKNRDSGYNVD